MINFELLEVPKEGERIEVVEGKLRVPDHPIIPFIEGDGVGPDIMRASMRVWEAAIKKAYGEKKRIVWFEVYAGDKASQKYREVLPQDTLRAIEHYIVAIKGPLTTPVGGGYRSLNVTLRQNLDIYACVRPVRYFSGVPSPVVHPEKMDMVIFRENTEDVYTGIEWPQGSSEARRIIGYFENEFGVHIRKDSGIGIKPMSITATKRLVRKSIRYAIDKNRRSITLVHKGNIMKYTEGAFKDWGYQVAKEEFGDRTIREDEIESRYGGNLPEGRIVIKDRIADNMFQQVLTRADEYDVIALPNLNGDYLSDACAAQVGGLGLSPGANIGDYTALFEATHGSAPSYAGQDKVNPGSLILSGVMMLEYLGWQEAADIIVKAVEGTIRQKRVTYDLARLMVEGVEPIRCSQFADAVVENMSCFS